jgi:8-oxo-dGTP diphosphatase
MPKPNQNILLSTDALVFRRKGENLQILLVTRKYEPNVGMWAFPGGFVEDDEGLEPAARRELEEETGLKVPAMEQLYTVGTPGRDPRGRTVSVVYYAFLEEDTQEVKGNDDAASAEWVNVKDITAMAFDHMEVLQYALQHLEGKLSRISPL